MPPVYSWSGDRKLFWKGPDSKYFRLCGAYVSGTHLCCCSMKGAMDNIGTIGHGYVPIKLFIRTGTDAFNLQAVVYQPLF